MALALALLAFLGPDTREPEAFVQAYLKSRLTKEASLEKFVGKEITLLAGHEYLKSKYGLTDNDERDEAIVVERKEFLKVDGAAMGELPDRKRKGLLDGIPDFGYDLKDLKPGINLLGPRERIRFTANVGDKAVFVRPKPKGDYFLFILRKAGETWHIVAEYLD